MRLISFILFLVLSLSSSGQDVVINEFMSSNSDILTDFEGDFPDWIELYNTSNSAVDISGFGISDDGTDPFKWTLPNVSINPNEFLVVFASGKDISSGELHTNFKISSTGESLLLTNSSGSLLQLISPVQLAKNTSFGSFSDVNENYQVQSVPTPGDFNSNSPNVSASHSTGFYSETVDLELISNQSLEIRYTTNGAIPDSESQLFTGNLSLSELDKTDLNFSLIPTTPLTGPESLQNYIWKEPTQTERLHVIRFAAFSGPDMMSRVETRTMVIEENPELRHDLPIISICADSTGFFGYDEGIYVPGARFDQDGFQGWPIGNYHNRGDNWEREVNVTWLTEEGERLFETNAGVRLRGFGSVGYPQKSMNLHFRSEYGFDELKGDFFENEGPDLFNKLTLRNTGNDGIKSRMRDALNHELIREMGLDYQRTKAVVVYLNGEYWGIHHLRDKYGWHHFSEIYDLEREDVNIASCCGANLLGNASEYNDLIDYLLTLDSLSEADYELIKSKIDLDNYIKLQISEIYSANNDWPCNNYAVWNSNEPDSKWKFLGYDYDATMGYNYFTTNYDELSFEHASFNGDSWPYCPISNVLFRRLIEVEEFQALFTEAFHEALSTVYLPENIISKIDSLEQNVFSEMPIHIERYGHPISMEVWDDELGVLRNYAEKRPCYIAAEINAYFNSSILLETCFDELPVLSGLGIIPNPNNGEFFLANMSDDIFVGKVKIHDLSGRLIKKYNAVEIESNSQLFFNLENVNPGTYVISVVSGSVNESFKILVL